jgi:hypothetical protein
MNRSFAVTLFAAAMCVPSAVASAQDPAKGMALLAEARKALGGEERLRAVKTLDARGDFKRAAGQITAEGRLQIRLEVPDKLRRDEDLSLPGGGPAVIRTEVLNGATVWDENSGGGAFLGRFGRGDGGGGNRGRDGGTGRAALDPAQIEEAQRRARQTDLARLLLAWLLVSDGQVAWVATAESPDGKADVLEITPTTGPATRLFLDQASHLPLMITWQGAQQFLAFARRGGRGGARGAGDTPPAAPQGPPAEVTFQMTLGDYKTVNGVRLPHLMTRGVNDTTIEEWIVKDYRINPSFRADVFNR